MLHSGDNCLTGIRQPTSGVTPSGHGQGFVAYPAALIAFYQVMMMKSLPAQAAFVTPNPKAGLPDPSPEVLPVEHDPSRTEKVCVLCTQGFLKFDRDRTGGLQAASRTQSHGRWHISESSRRRDLPSNVPCDACPAWSVLQIEPVEVGRWISQG